MQPSIISLCLALLAASVSAAPLHCEPVHEIRVCRLKPDIIPPDPHNDIDGTSALPVRSISGEELARLNTTYLQTVAISEAIKPNQALFDRIHSLPRLSRQNATSEFRFQTGSFPINITALGDMVRGNPELQKLSSRSLLKRLPRIATQGLTQFSGSRLRARAPTVWPHGIVNLDHHFDGDQVWMSVHTGPLHGLAGRPVNPWEAAALHDALQEMVSFTAHYPLQYILEKDGKRIDEPRIQSRNQRPVSVWLLRGNDAWGTDRHTAGAVVGWYQHLVSNMVHENRFGEIELGQVSFGTRKHGKMGVLEIWVHDAGRDELGRGGEGGTVTLMNGTGTLGLRKGALRDA